MRKSKVNVLEFGEYYSKIKDLPKYNGMKDQLQEWTEKQLLLMPPGWRADLCIKDAYAMGYIQDAPPVKSPGINWWFCIHLFKPGQSQGYTLQFLTKGGKSWDHIGLERATKLLLKGKSILHPANNLFPLKTIKQIVVIPKQPKVVKQQVIKTKALETLLENPVLINIKP